MESQGWSAALQEAGLQARVVDARHAADLRQEIENLRREGCLDQEFFDERLTFFEYNPPPGLAAARSLIIVAVPHPQSRLGVVWQDRELEVLVPPTYVRYRQVDQLAQRLLEERLVPAGHRVVRAHLPSKALAVHSGLARYGRNNVCFVPDMGSYLRLVGFWSDMPVEHDGWGPAGMMEACEACSACRKACPTGAIPSDRFLLRAERCLTFHDERTADFPAWIDPGWHECLVGCMRCQRICPANRPHRDWSVVSASFCADETDWLLKKTELSQLPENLRSKLEGLDLAEYWEVLRRNLKAFLLRSQACPGTVKLAVEDGPPVGRDLRAGLPHDGSWRRE